MKTPRIEDVARVIEKMKRFYGPSGALTIVFPHKPGWEIEQLVTRLGCAMDVDPQCPPGRFFVQVDS